MKLVQACLSVRKDLENSFHHTQVREMSDKNGFNRRGGPMKVVQACLCVRKDLESCLHRCGGPVRLVQACICA